LTCFLLRNFKTRPCFIAINLKFVLQYAIRGVQVQVQVQVRVKQDGWKLNVTYQVAVCADYVNILGGNLHNIKENAEAFSSC